MAWPPRWPRNHRRAVALSRLLAWLAPAATWLGLCNILAFSAAGLHSWGRGSASVPSSSGRRHACRGSNSRELATWGGREGRGGAPASPALAGRTIAGSPRPSASATARWAATLDNEALVFVKPHASTPAAVDAVAQVLQARHVAVLRTGTVTGEDIARRGTIDAHYASIAKIGMVRDLQALKLGGSVEEKFDAGYGISWAAAADAGRLHSAATALELLQVTPTELLNQCLAAGYEKLGPGLYAARLDGPAGQPVYVLNGFYARMREKFVAPGVVVHWFVVRFGAGELPWRTFRGSVIGATNPADAAAGSLRAKFRDEWASLGLREPTNYQDNAVHASASPLEALRERAIWLGDEPGADPFGAALAARVGGEQVSRLLENPVIKLADGREGRAFDLLEDTDTPDALDLLAAAEVVRDA